MNNACLKVNMSDLKERFLLLENDVCIGIFRFRNQHRWIFIMISSNGEFTQIQAEDQIYSNLTRFISVRFEEIMKRLLKFRNLFAKNVYLCERFIDENKFITSSNSKNDNQIHWTSSSLQFPLFRSSQISKYLFITDKLSFFLCPVRKCLFMISHTLFQTENSLEHFTGNSVLPNGSQTPTKCSSITAYPYHLIPTQLVQLITYVCTNRKQPHHHINSHISNNHNINNRNDNHNLTQNTITSTTSRPQVVTYLPSSQPLGASHSHFAQEMFTELSPYLPLLRDADKYPNCKATVMVDCVNGIVYYPTNNINSNSSSGNSGNSSKNTDSIGDKLEALFYSTSCQTENITNNNNEGDHTELTVTSWIDVNSFPDNSNNRVNMYETTDQLEPYFDALNRQKQTQQQTQNSNSNNNNNEHDNNNISSIKKVINTLKYENSLIVLSLSGDYFTMSYHNPTLNKNISSETEHNENASPDHVSNNTNIITKKVHISFLTYNTAEYTMIHTANDENNGDNIDDYLNFEHSDREVAYKLLSFLNSSSTVSDNSSNSNFNSSACSDNHMDVDNSDNNNSATNDIHTEQISMTDSRNLQPYEILTLLRKQATHLLLYREYLQNKHNNMINNNITANEMNDTSILLQNYVTERKNKAVFTFVPPTAVANNNKHSIQNSNINHGTPTKTVHAPQSQHAYHTPPPHNTTNNGNKHNNNNNTNSNSSKAQLYNPYNPPYNTFIDNEYNVSFENREGDKFTALINNINNLQYSNVYYSNSNNSSNSGNTTDNSHYSIDVVRGKYKDYTIVEYKISQQVFEVMLPDGSKINYTAEAYHKRTGIFGRHMKLPIQQTNSSNSSNTVCNDISNNPTAFSLILYEYTRKLLAFYRLAAVRPPQREAMINQINQTQQMIVSNNMQKYRNEMVTKIANKELTMQQASEQTRKYHEMLAKQFQYNKLSNNIDNNNINSINCAPAFVTNTVYRSPVPSTQQQQQQHYNRHVNIVTPENNNTHQQHNNVVKINNSSTNNNHSKSQYNVVTPSPVATTTIRYTEGNLQSKSDIGSEFHFVTTSAHKQDISTRHNGPHHKTSDTELYSEISPITHDSLSGSSVISNCL